MNIPAEHYAHERAFGRPTVGIALFIAFAFISVPPILLFGSWLSRQQSREAIDRFDQEASMRAESIEEAVSEYIRLKQEVLNITAGTLSVMPLWHKDELQDITDAQIKSSASFDSFYVGNPQGISLVFAPSYRADGSRTQSRVDYSDRDYYKRLHQTKRVALGNIKLGRQSKVVNVHIAVPIYQDLDLKEKGSLRGFITGGIKTQLIEQVMSRMIKGSDNLRAILVEVDQRVVADSDQEVPIFTKLPESSIYATKCHDSKGSIESLDLKRSLVRAICREISIESLRWTLWVSTPKERITADANRSISFTTKIALFLLFGVILVAAFLSSWVARLMGLITMNAQRVSSGHFDITLPKVRWFTPREVVEVGNISLQTLARVRESDNRVRGLVHNLETVNKKLAPLAEAWRQVSEAIEILSPSGEVLFANPAFYELLHIDDVKDRQETLHHSSQLFKITDPISELRSIGEVIISHAQAGLSWSSEIDCQIERKSRVHSITSSPIFDHREQLIRVVVLRRDITEERFAQASAAHNDRLAAIGTLAAGMAHEINNPMTYIKMSLDLIQENLEKSPLSDKVYQLDEDSYNDLIDAVSDATEGVDRVTEIVRSLLSIARSGGERGEGERMSQVDLDEVIMSCANLVKPEFSKTVDLLIESKRNLRVWGRRSELIQVLLNLMMNAAQAMPLKRASNDWVKVRAQRLETGQIQLAVIDNARGIPSSDLEHIFDPFFSSKPVGKGTGLGLAVSRGILEAHHAVVKVQSIEGEGTSFIITFPALNQFPDATETMLGLPEIHLVDQARQSKTPIQITGPDRSLIEETSPHRTQQKILIVDDDPLVAKSLARMLNEEQVMIASNGVTAIETLKTYPFDLILSDVMMPEMDGPTLYTEIERLFPQYRERFIFITGAAKGDQVTHALAMSGRLVLNKPITKKQLMSVVNRITRS